MNESQKSINIVAAALGGQGGAVFTNWLIEVAESNGWRAQTTSLAGVAQRTGATIYYIELIPRDDASAADPVLSLFPSPGDIDIAICSEIAEAGRMLQRGFISKDKTALITSSNRVYSITEKIDLADGTIEPELLLDLSKQYAKDLIAFDMQSVADQHKSVISSVMLGALAGSGSLPFSKQSFLDAIAASGKAVNTSQAAFNAGFEKAQSGDVQIFEPEAASPAPLAALNDSSFADPIARLPNSARETAVNGVNKLCDYQDADYAKEYLSHLQIMAELDDGTNDSELTELSARYLALWMSFEDVPRVAQLKLRESRMSSIREEVGATESNIMYVTEYFKPRPEEMCAIMPAGIGAKVLASKLGYKILTAFSGGKKLRTNTISIFLALKLLAGMRKFRRGSLGYQHEHNMINSWLDAIKAAAKRDVRVAIEIAKCGRLVKGYGDTRHRTSEQTQQIVDHANRTQTSNPDEIAQLLAAALADDSNEAFSKALPTTTATAA
ncbi:MAG: indolepyruvate oxidoreductase subunit beta family protein [Pseudomonadales bacterium]